MTETTKIETIGNSLKDLISERKIVARCELLNRAYQFVREADLDQADREEISKLVGKHIASGIFSNVLSGDPIFSGLPKLDTYAQIQGRIFHFHHTQKYSKQDFDNAYRKFLSARTELRILLQANLEDLLTEFMSEAEYSLDGREGQVLRFSAPGRVVRAKVYTSVHSVNPEDCRKASYQAQGSPQSSEAISNTASDAASGTVSDAISNTASEVASDTDSDCVILIPSGENLQPYVQFFRDRGAEIEESGVQVWVANLEQGTIDPFIGFTTDMDIYKQFKNPRLAANVRSTWGRPNSAPVE
jgi:hypothetical protein